MKITSVLIDDEPGNIVTLTELLTTYCPQISIEGSAPNPDKAFDLIQKVQPRLVFLDIEMPYGNAFDLLDKLSPVTFEVIFITAFSNYAVKAFKYAAVDYILKPVNIRELKEAVQKATSRLEEKSVNIRIESLLGNLKSENVLLQKIGLPVVDGLYFEDLDNIAYFKASGNYAHVFCRGEKEKLVTKSLKEFEEILPGEVFCRVHHSYLVNINHIKKYYKGNGGYVEMEDGAAIEVSTRKKEEFLRKIRH